MHTNTSKYQDILAKAEHYIAIGYTEINLWDGDDDDRPWDLVNNVIKGSLTRCEVEVSLHFKALHPCGLLFAWIEHIEPCDANGTGYLQPDIDRLVTILAQIPEAARPSMHAALRSVASKMGEQATEQQKFATRMRKAADSMGEIVQLRVGEHPANPKNGNENAQGH